MMDAQDVLDVLSVLGEAGLSKVWLYGGWGVDALLGAQHRDHRDLDLVLPVLEIDLALNALRDVGFTITTDHRPTRMELMDRDGRVIDFHPVRFDDSADGWQAGAAPAGGDALYPAESFTYGWVAGQRVPCIGPEVQVEHHSGYEPRNEDREDIGRIQERFAVAVPDVYR